MAFFRWGLLIALTAGVALLVAGQLGFLQGHPPGNLGVYDGRLKPPSLTNNSVSSQAHLYPDHPMREQASIAPLQAADPMALMQDLSALLATLPEAELVRREPGYIYARFTTRWLRFVDDVEFWADRPGGVVHVRSASRLGREDMGTNRARIERLRLLLATPAV